MRAVNAGARLALAVLGLGLLGCESERRPRTQLYVWMRTDVDPADIERVELRIERGDGRGVETARLDAGALPGSFAVAPMPGDDLEDTEVHIEIEATTAIGELRTEIRARFIPGQMRLVEAYLRRACRGCSEGSTCTLCGGCEDVALEEGVRLSREEREAIEDNPRARLDRSTCGDGGTPEAGSLDAQVDASDGGDGDAGDGGVPCGPEPRCEGDGCVDDLALGARHGCAVTRDKRLVCWGANDQAQLALPRDSDIHPQREIPHPDGLDWVQVAASDTATCALDEQGTSLCWGKRGHAMVRKPTAAIDDVVMLPEGWGCGHERDGGLERCWFLCEDLFCFGGGPLAFPWPSGDPADSPDGGAADPLEGGAADPLEGGAADSLDGGAPDRPTRIALYLGTPARFFDVLTSKGEVWHWEFETEDTPELLPAKVLDMSTQGAVCTIDKDTRALTCRGPNSHGEAGQPAGTAVDDDAPVREGTKFSHVAGSETVTCAVAHMTTDVWCWGSSDYSLLGSQASMDAGTPLRVIEGECGPYVHLEIGRENACAKRLSGHWDCWGGRRTVSGLGENEGKIELKRLVIDPQ